MANRAPKQWTLTKTETVNTFENWRQNLIYILSLDLSFAPFLDPTVVWSKKTRTSFNRGLANDPNSVPVAMRRTSVQKAAQLEMMLGQIANYCPIISRNTIVKNSTSLASIWQAIRSHYGFQSTGSHFLDLAGMKLENEERPEDLFQRLTAFFEDNLLVAESGLTHHGAEAIDEDMTPSLENTITLLWLKLIHTDLPKLVKQRYGTELRSRTLASIKPEISQALGSLLDELHSTEEGRVMRMSSNRNSNFGGHNNSRGPSSNFRNQSRNQPRNHQGNQHRSKPTCILCKEANRPRTDHFLSSCPHLPEGDRRFMSRARMIHALEEEESYHEFDDTVEQSYEDNIANHTDELQALTINRVQMKPSPCIQMFYEHHPVTLTLDTGAETNLIRESTATLLGLTVSPSTQFAIQADGLSQLKIIGETKVNLHRDGKDFFFDALVTRNIDTDILAGIPFLSFNDISIRPAKREISLSDGTTYQYGEGQNNKGSHSVRRAQTILLRAPSSSSTIWPGDYLEVNGQNGCEDQQVALEPRTDIKSDDIIWPTHAIVQSIAGKIRIPNNTEFPIVIKRHEHIAQISPVFDPSPTVTSKHSSVASKISIVQSTEQLHSNGISLNPDQILSNDETARFRSLHRTFDHVFDPTFNGYNGAVGNLFATVNMGPVLPPQRKGKLPQYARTRLEELQNRFDELESLGVFAKPEDLGITVEYVNPSFLVKKSNGGSRLVTAFTEVGKYAKPQPSLMPNVDSTLREIAKWRYIVKTDLTKAFYQIPLAINSMKYCGVVTPFRGVRVYQRCAMGMPGSETALEELMSRILGDLLMSGKVAKIADDLYCGADDIPQLIENWKSVLKALDNCDLRLSPTKTVVCPKSTTILGWMWSQGTLSATKHRISTLSSCDPPNTIKGLRSFIGAYKILSRVVKGCSSILAPLETAVAGKLTSSKIEWSDQLHTAFTQAKQRLSTSNIITLPKPDDQIWIVTDGAVREPGVGATYYITRNEGKPSLAGFFSAKLKKHQPSWLPCEIEALSIATAIKHFSPYLIQSKHRACVMTDSKPCVQAYEKLARGSFSHSTRVYTFLSTASNFHVSIRHLSGAANLPSDFSSRNAPSCESPKCQICLFVNQIEECVINSVTVSDIISGDKRLPFTTRTTWLSIQAECSDIRRTIAHLKQGTRPSKKITNIKDVKRYIRVSTIARDGLLVVRKEEPFSPVRECIVVPRDVMPGLLTALHIQLQHPTPHQLKQVVLRSFFALDLDNMIERTSHSCHHCESLKNAKRILVEQSTSEPPTCIGISFASDVIRRNRQFILLLRETVTSFTSACIIPDEQSASLVSGLLQLMLPLHPMEAPIATIRTDPAPGFKTICANQSLKSYGIQIELGHAKNINKNPVAEKAVQELEREILNQDPSGDPISTSMLASAVSRLNTRIRGQGLSAHEMWHQREQFTNTQLNTSDQHLITQQHNRRLASHTHLSNRPLSSHLPPIKPGDIIYIRSERSKTHARSRYLVVSIEDSFCYIRKFTKDQLRNNTYKVRLSDCYLVTADVNLNDPNTRVTETVANSDVITSDDDSEVPRVLPHHEISPPAIPPEISSLPTTVINKESTTSTRSGRNTQKPAWLHDYEH